MAKRNPVDHLIITLKGMAMGIAELVPGVSAGTIAFVSGIYEEFISSINNVNLKTLRLWRKEGFQSFWKALNGNFLLALVLGMAISILAFTKLVRWLLENEPILIWSFFFGLVLASVIFVAKDIKRWNVANMLLLIGGAVIAYYLTQLPPSENANSLLYLFFSGALAVCAMILPGISGSFIMVLLGAYKTIIDALDEKDFKIIITVGLGILFGILSFARVLKWMFDHYKNITLSVLTGFILGSLNKIWPWKKVLETRTFGDKEKIIAEQSVSPFSFEGDPQLIFAVIAAIAGFSLIFILERTASKK
jgi:putative membrane protein